MTETRHRVARTLIACTAALLTVGQGVSYATDPVATTHPATSISFDSAVLNGHVNTSGGSAWYFEYAATGAKQLSKTPPQPISSSQDVSVKVKGLTPATQYFFRLVVETDKTETTQVDKGAFVSFTTASPPSSVATTGNATSVKRYSAVLNGVINAHDPHTLWTFQYGTSSSYGKFTKVRSAGAGLTVISTILKGLNPGTRYHYRLVVVQGNGYNATASYGVDRSVRTKRLVTYGKTSVLSQKLKVKQGRVSIPIKCSGVPGAVCKGKLKLSTRGAGAIRCAGARFSLSAGHAHAVNRKVTSSCLALLNSATARQLDGTLRGSFGGHQTRLKLRVTLVA